MKRAARGRISRRGFLLFAAAGVTGSAAFLANRRWRSTHGVRHQAANAAGNRLDQSVNDTLVAFLAVFFGVNFDEVDRVDISQRLLFAVERNDGWHADYKNLANFLDAAAEDQGAESFVTGDAEQQLLVVDSLVWSKKARIRNRIRAMISDSGIEFLRMQRSTLPHLFRLYRHSGVPWRHRGYDTWPGAAGEMLAYTRAPADIGS
jgi:hypothetical protein